MRQMPRSLRLRLTYFACSVAIVLGCGAYYKTLWHDYDTFNRSIDQVCHARYCDFTYFYYKQAQHILDSDRPIKKYYYSPSFAIMLVPFGRLPLEQAHVAWSWFQALSLVMLLAASASLLREQPGWVSLLMLSLTLTSYPVLHNWRWGQANVTFMALVVLALALAERGKLKLAALSLALVAASRYYPAMYALAFVAPRRHAALRWFVVFGLLLSAALPVLVMGPDRAWSFYVHSAKAVSNAYATFITSRSSGYMPTTVIRLARLWKLGPVGSFEVWTWIARGLAVCNALTVLIVIRRRVPERTLWSFCFVALSTPLLAPTSWVHYFVYLPLVQAFLLAQLATLPRHLLLRAAALGLAWLPSVYVSTIFFFQRHPSARDYAERGYVLLSNLGLLALAYLVLLARKRSELPGVQAPDGLKPRARPEGPGRDELHGVV
jgi:hypothetical protein